MKKTLVFMLLMASVLVAVILAQDKYGCEKDNRDQCLLAFIENEPVDEIDEEVCGEIGNPENKKLCFFTLAQRNGVNGLALCDQLDNKGELNRDYCYYSIALSERDQLICQQVSAKEQKNLCTKTLSLASS
ncbi:hypothetical protein HYV87_00995 [Candidatus Woesearchaeota archaeon]|nr:hypothetical protein [Candidatus Woesearchaeota archaeon]